MLRTIRDDLESLQAFLAFHQSCIVRLGSIGPPCMTLALEFYYPNKDRADIDGYKSELLCFPTSIHMPKLEWTSAITVSEESAGGDANRKLTIVEDLPSGIRIECSGSIMLLVDTEFDVPGIKPA
jgi:hypothetical protein